MARSQTTGEVAKSLDASLATLVTWIIQGADFPRSIETEAGAMSRTSLIAVNGGRTDTGSCYMAALPHLPQSSLLVTNFNEIPAND